MRSNTRPFPFILDAADHPRHEPAGRGLRAMIPCTVMLVCAAVAAMIIAAHSRQGQSHAPGQTIGRGNGDKRRSEPLPSLQ
jgi:hypothetical protein